MEFLDYKSPQGKVRRFKWGIYAVVAVVIGVVHFGSFFLLFFFEASTHHPSQLQEYAVGIAAFPVFTCLYDFSSGSMAQFVIVSLANSLVWGILWASVLLGIGSLRRKVHFPR